MDRAETKGNYHYGGDEVMSRQFLLSYEEPWYVVKDIVSGVATQGETIEEAKNNLREALELYYEDSEMEEM